MTAKSSDVPPLSYRRVGQNFGGPANEAGVLLERGGWSLRARATHHVHAPSIKPGASVRVKYRVLARALRLQTVLGAGTQASRTIRHGSQVSPGLELIGADRSGPARHRLLAVPLHGCSPPWDKAPFPQLNFALRIRAPTTIANHPSSVVLCLVGPRWNYHPSTPGPTLSCRDCTLPVPAHSQPHRPKRHASAPAHHHPSTMSDFGDDGDVGG